MSTKHSDTPCSGVKRSWAGKGRRATGVPAEKSGKEDVGAGVEKPTQPKPGKVPRNLGGKQPQECSQNLAYQRVWMGYEWLQPFERKVMPIFQDLACAQKAAMDAHLDHLAESCVHLSLLAHAYDVPTVQWLDKRDWHAIDLAQLFAVLRHFCARVKYTADVWVYDPDTGGKLEHMSKVGSQRGSIWNVNLLIVRTMDTDSALHVLPLCGVNANASIVKQAPLEKPVEKPTGEVPTTSQPENPQEAQPAVLEPEQGDADPDQQGYEYPDVPAIEAEWLGRPLEDNAGPEDDYVLVPQIPGPPEVRFSGIEPPPANWSWCSSPWQSQVPRDRSWPVVFRLDRPHVCSALLSEVVKYGATVKYLPPTESDRLYYLERGGNHITDGVIVDEVFVPGDVVTLGGVWYKCQPAVFGEVQVIELVQSGLPTRQNCARRLLSHLTPLIDSAKEACIIPLGKPKLPAESKSKAEWIASVHSEADPLKLAIKQRLRQDAAADGYKTLSAVDADRFTSLLARKYPAAQVVAGIPGCFSCGQGGKEKRCGRLCKSCAAGANSQLGKMVADGHQVSGPSNRIVYPGVVNTTSRHPPLKTGVLTLATGSNFQ